MNAPLIPAGLFLVLVLGCGGTPGRECLEVPGNICPFAGSGKAGVGAEGEPASQTELFQPMDAAVGPGGEVFVVDWNNHRVRAVDAGGVIRTVIGTGRIGDGLDGPATSVDLYQPTDLAFDAEGRALLAAWRNHQVMRLSKDGELTTVAGSGKRGFEGDGALATLAKLDLPSSVAVGPDGALFVADQGNRRVRRVGPDGRITTVAGTGDPGFGGDGGPATQAQLDSPAGQSASPSGKLAVGGDGVLYLADSGNHRVRRVGPDGLVTTVAGTGEAAFGGDGGPATQAALSRPTDVALAPDGSLYVADTDNSCIRRIGPDAVITTAAGVCGQAGDEGDGGPATSARLQRPFGIHVDPEGRLFIADTFNHRIRVVVPAASR
jgi:sugar lactone lactonase YvrE